MDITEYNYIWLVVTGTWMDDMTFHSYWEWKIILADFQSIIFQRGSWRKTTNQIINHH